MSTFASTTESRSTQGTIEEEEDEVEAISKKNELQVFLGGSCNPTTWRQNLAIPYLEMNGISYYNPQIDNWTPEVVELEHRAKQEAQILLFVIDNQTRATVTLIESAFLAADDKTVVFVFYPFESKINTEHCIGAYNLYETDQIMKEKTISLLCTASLESASITSSSNIEVPDLRVTSAHNRASKSSSRLNLLEVKSDGRSTNMDMGRRDLSRSTSCSLRLAGETITVDEFRELKQARSILENLINMRKIPTFPDIPQALNHISCQIRGTIPHKKSDSSSWCDELYSNNVQSRQHLIESNKHFTGCTNELPVKDVYLSIDSDDCTIMDTTVVPMLEANGLTYNYMSMKDITNSQRPLDGLSFEHAQGVVRFSNEKMTPYDLESRNKSCDDQALELVPEQPNDKTEPAIEKELYAIRTSKVLLFVITNKCRGLSIMVLASYFMALLRNNVVLCVQYLEEPCTVGGEELSKTAIADYNRGRVYLCDDAVKSRVPVFSSIREAIECCSRKCQHIK